jgi:hypothetical protein
MDSRGKPCCQILRRLAILVRANGKACTWPPTSMVLSCILFFLVSSWELRRIALPVRVLFCIFIYDQTEGLWRAPAREKKLGLADDYRYCASTCRKKLSAGRKNQEPVDDSRVGLRRIVIPDMYLYRRNNDPCRLATIESKQLGFKMLGFHLLAISS